MLNPKFVEYKKIDLEELEIEKEMSNTKSRWGENERVLKEKESEESTRVKIVVNVKEKTESQESEDKPMFATIVKDKKDKEEEEMKSKCWEEMYREVYDRENKQLDFRKKRATDVKSCKRVKIPRPKIRSWKRDF